MASTWRGAAAGLMLMLLRMVAGQAPAGRAGYSILVKPPNLGATWVAPLQVSSPVLNTEKLTLQAWVLLQPKTDTSDISYIVGTLSTLNPLSCLNTTNCGGTTYLGPCSIQCGLSSTASTNEGFLLFCGESTTSTAYCGFIVSSSNTLYQITSEGRAIDLNVWTHISATYNNGTMKFYVDTKEANSIVLPPLIRSGNLNAISIGGRMNFQATSQTSYVSGAVDEIRIWETAREGWQLSMDAFETACNASLLSRCNQNGLAYYWSFNDTGAMTSTYFDRQAEPVVSGASHMDKLVQFDTQTAGGASLKDQSMQIYEFKHDQVGNLQILLFDANPLDRLDLIALDSTLLTSLKITTQVQACSCFDIFNCSCHQCSFPTICQGDQWVGSYHVLSLTWRAADVEIQLVPQHGFPLAFVIKEIPSNFFDPLRAAPTRSVTLPLYLFTWMPLEFIPPTPGGNSSQAFEMQTYIGDHVEFVIQVLLRNVDQDVIFSMDEMYGSPSYATFSDFTSNLATRAADEPIQVSQRFSWTPVCQQAGLARVLFLVTSREVPSLSISKLIHIDVVRPQPVIVNMSTSSREMRVGCEMRMEVQAADGSEETRTRNNSAYGQDFNFTLWRWENGTRRAIPLTTAGVSIGEAEWNQYNGTTGRLLWKPVRGQEGGEYELCVAVRDRCHVGVEANECVNMSIAKCQACLAAGDSLEGLARQYRTDFLSLYTFNVGLGNPDSVTVDRPINVGFLYRVKAGDTLDELGRTFFTDIGSLLEVNSDIAERNNVATQYWRGPTAVEVGNVSSVIIFPDEDVCIVNMMCYVQCDSRGCLSSQTFV